MNPSIKTKPAPTTLLIVLNIELYVALVSLFTKSQLQVEVAACSIPNPSSIKQAPIVNATRSILKTQIINTRTETTKPTIVAINPVIFFVKKDTI